jgi:hypothetical protein
VLEILVAIFVMLIGVTGVMSLFPVGVKLSQTSTDDVYSAITAQNALAEVRIQTGLLTRLRPFGEDGGDASDEGDVLCWASGESKGVDGITGTIQNVDPITLGPTKVEVNCTDLDGRTFAVKDGSGDGYALMMMTSGDAQWKLYRLDLDDYTANSTVGSVNNGCTNFPEDGVESGDAFRLLGCKDQDGVWATIPELFYTDASGTDRTTFNLGPGAVKGYGYLAILTRVKDLSSTYRVDILVFKGYDKALPPEGNLSAVACYTTMLSSEMLR